MEDLLALQALDEQKVFADSAEATPLDSCVAVSCNGPSPI